MYEGDYAMIRETVVMSSPFFLFIILILLSHFNESTFALSPGSSKTSSPSSSSPWSPSPWSLTLNIGRESSTSLMPKEWSVSGARLVLPLIVLIDSEAVPLSSVDNVVGSIGLAEKVGGGGGGGGGQMSIKSLEAATYINDRGQCSVEVIDGGWEIELPRGKEGRAGSLRIWLDVRSGNDDDTTTTNNIATRNDVYLPSGRLYLTSPCWRRPDFKKGRLSMIPLESKASYFQRLLEETLDHTGGDRRLDGDGSPLDTVKAFGDVAALVAERDVSASKVREAYAYLPGDTDEDLSFGSWPGAPEQLVVRGGLVMMMGVGGKTNFFWGNKGLDVIGTWGVTPFE